jgi:hypothetical protein
VLRARRPGSGPARAIMGAQRQTVGVSRDIVDGAARRTIIQLVGERGEGDGEVDGTPDGVAP